MSKPTVALQTWPDDDISLKVNGMYWPKYDTVRNTLTCFYHFSLQFTSFLCPIVAAEVSGDQLW